LILMKFAGSGNSEESGGQRAGLRCVHSNSGKTGGALNAFHPEENANCRVITIDGPNTVVFLNGARVTDFAEGQPVPPKEHGSGDPDRGPWPNEGYIGLQNQDGGKVYFREVSLRSLS
jgi:hypothetical protein